MQPLDTSPTDTGLPPVAVHPDRRRHVRHKVHTPAYACLNPSAEQPLDLCEIVDLSETGMAIQAYAPLDVGREESFSLDLTETGAFLQTAGNVIWSDTSGRMGIRFLPTIDASLSPLRQWLFANAIAGSENSPEALQNEVAAPQQASATPEIYAVSVELAEYEAPSHADYTAVLSGLVAVKREVESLGADLDAVLQLLVRRSLNFTRATGAAIAMTEGQEMLCRASAGADAPPLGARLQAEVGFSGQCVRTGNLLRCDDSETDPRVDREGSRSLGIRSMIAVPIRRETSVIGLLEVFSPQPVNFEASDEIVLQRMADIVSAALNRAASPLADPMQKISPPVDDEFPIETPADLPIPLPQLSQSRNLVLIGAALTVVFVIAWLIGSWDNNRVSGPIPPRSPAQAAQGSSQPFSPLPTAVDVSDDSIQGLRRLADQGDSVAEFAVGARYATGEGVPADFAEAARWFAKAAEEGNVAAQSTLGTYYWAGRGVSRDPIKAYFWSLVAEADGDTTSRDRADLVATHLTHGQKLAVQQQAKQWVQQHPPANVNAAAQ